MASISMNEMRKVVMNEYNGMAWRARVAKMEDKQVIAIYHRIINQKIREDIEPKQDYHQIDMFEYLMDKKEEKDSMKEKLIPSSKIQQAIKKAETDYANMLPAYMIRDNAMVFSLRYVKELLNSLLDDEETDAK